MALTRGRVLPADASARASRLAGPPPGAGRSERVILAEVVAAHDEARRIVERARSEGRALIEAARKAAGSAREDAEREGRQAAEAALAAAFLRLREAQRAQLEGQKDEVIALARLLSERLLGRALELDPQVMVDLAREALSSVARARRVTLFVHPDDAGALRADLGALGLSAPVLEVHLDPSRPRGSLRAVTDVGTLDAELAPQLDRLSAALRGP